MAAGHPAALPPRRRPHHFSIKINFCGGDCVSSLSCFFNQAPPSLDNVALPCYQTEMLLHCQHFNYCTLHARNSEYSQPHTAVARCPQRVDGSTREGSASIDARNWHQKFQSPWLSHVYGSLFVPLRGVRRGASEDEARPGVSMGSRY